MLSPPGPAPPKGEIPSGFSAGVFPAVTVDTLSPEEESYIKGLATLYRRSAKATTVAMVPIVGRPGVAIGLQEDQSSGKGDVKEGSIFDHHPDIDLLSYETVNESGDLIAVEPGSLVKTRTSIRPGSGSGSGASGAGTPTTEHAIKSTRSKYQ